MIIYDITPPRKKQYARAERRQNGGVKRGFDRVFFLANREEKQGANRRESSVANASKNRERAVFRRRSTEKCRSVFCTVLKWDFCLRCPFFYCVPKEPTTKTRSLCFKRVKEARIAPRPFFYSIVRLTHSVQRGSVLISFSVCESQGRRQNGQSSGNFSTTPRFEGSNLYFTPETSGAV